MGRNGCAKDGPQNSDMELGCNCWRCTVCWQEERNNDRFRCTRCDVDIKQWLSTHYDAHSDESDSAQAQRALPSLISAHRADFVTWLQTNRTKRVREVSASFAGDEDDPANTVVANSIVYNLIAPVQPQLFIATMDESRFGPMPFDVYRSLLKDFEAIKYYAIATVSRPAQ